MKEWLVYAACKGTDTTLFFSDGTSGSTQIEWENRQAALALCRRCPVRRPCLEYALKNENYGIWGGTGERERRRMRSERRRVSA